jgi:predicted MFS family arabinose efflux permease
MGVGTGEAGCQPASVSLVRDLFPAHQRASATAILLVGAPAGACLGLLFGGWMGTQWGWRMALIVATVPGLVVAAIMFLTMRDPAVRTPAKAETGTLIDAIKVLARRRSLLWLTVAFGCQTFCLHATAAWLPVFFIRAHDMSAMEAGRYLGLAVGIGGAMGALGVGFLCDFFRKRGKQRDWLLIQIVMLANLPLIAITVLTPNVMVAQITLVVLSMTVYGYLGPTPVLIQEQATDDTRSLSLGGVTSVANIMSMCVGVPVVGLLSDVLNPRFGEPAVGYALMLMIAAAAILGVLALGAARAAAKAPAAGATPLADASL